MVNQNVRPFYICLNIDFIFYIFTSEIICHIIHSSCDAWAISFMCKACKDHFSYSCLKTIVQILKQIMKVFHGILKSFNYFLKRSKK